MAEQVDTNEQSFAEIPISAEIHERFVRTIKYFNLTLKITKGFYRVYYDDPTELYYFGAQMTIPTLGEENFKSAHKGLPVHHDHIKDNRKKDK